MSKKYVGVSRIAELLCTTPRAVYGRVYRNELPHYKAGKGSSRLLFDEAEIIQMIESNRVEAFSKKGV